MPAHDHAHGHGHDHGHGHGHDHGHGHGHAHGAPPADDRGNERRLLATLVLGCTYMGVEAVGGWLIGSLALVADAGHMLSDSAALAITLFALRMARLPADAKRTYGYHRAEVLAAVVNGAALLAIAVGVFWEAVERWGAAEAPDGPLVVAIASGGLLVNLAGLAILHGADRSGLNVRAAWLHLVSDSLGSGGAILAGLLVWYGGFTWADPLASVLIAALVLRSAWYLLKEAVDVLMEAAPPHVDTEAMRTAILAVDGVNAVHDVHVWTLTSGVVAMSGHVVAEGDASHPEVLTAVATLLRERFHIEHSTIQVEPPGYEEAELHP